MAGTSCPMELGVDAALAHTTGDELRVLAAEIEHEHGPHRLPQPGPEVLGAHDRR